MLPALVIAASLVGPAVDLQWDAPEGCPSQAVVAGQIAAMIGDSPGPPARVVFRVERRDDRWHLVGEISGVADSGRRELSAASCEELAEAAVLIVAIAVDPPVVPEPVAAEPGPAVTEPVPAAVEPGPAVTEPGPVVEDDVAPEVVPEAALPKTRRRVSALVGLGGGVGLGALPGPAGVVRLALGVRGDRWSAAVVQDVWLPRTELVSSMPAYGGRFWLWSAGLRGCGIVPAGRLEVPLCATIAAGVMAGKGTGALSVTRSRQAPWVAASAGPGLRVPLGRGVGLLFGAEFVAVLARPRFDITGEDVVCCESRVGGQFTGGIELRLP